MNYEQYKNSRDLAWEILIQYSDGRLPVDLKRLAKQLNVSFSNYTKGAKLIHQLELAPLCYHNDGFAMMHKNGYIVFYDERIFPKERIRFTIAHELGHILLRHALSPIGQQRIPATTQNNGEMMEYDNMEFAANIFASRILAPACVLYELGITDAKKISKLCGLSMQAATYRAARMDELIRRNAWYKHPLERNVKAIFSKFILHYKKMEWEALKFEKEMR